MSRFSHYFWQQNRPILIPITLIVLTLLLLPFESAVGPNAIAWYGFFSFLVYASAIVSFILVLKPGKPVLGKYTDEIGAVFLAAVWPLFMIAWFMIGWSFFEGQYSGTAACAGSPSWDMCQLTNAAYFSTATFTSTGYGDFVPTTLPGRWCAAIEMLVGHVNALVFFGVLFSRVDRWRNKPKLKQKWLVKKARTRLAGPGMHSRTGQRPPGGRASQ